MSSLETLTPLELAHGRPKSISVAERRSSPIAAGIRLAVHELAAFGHRSLLLILLLVVWEAAPRIGLIDPVFLPSRRRPSPLAGSARKPGSSRTTSRRACCAR